MKFRRTKRPKPYLPTASMADIAFLLFIFFAVTTSIEKDLGLKLVLPRTQKPEPMPRGPVRYRERGLASLARKRADSTSFLRAQNNGCEMNLRCRFATCKTHPSGFANRSF